MRIPKRVMITCVGSGVGQSAVDSLRTRKDEYFLVGSDRNRHCYSAPDCDDFVTLPPIDDPAYVQALLEACSAHGIDALIPGHDLELGLVARERRRFESVGTQPIVAGAALVTLLRDKSAWSREFGSRTRRVVRACSPAEFRAGVARGLVPLPAIAKPAGGSASSGLRILHKPEDAEGLGEDFVIQPFLFPAAGDPELEAIRAAVAAGRVVQASEISVQLVYARDGALLGRFASRNRLKAGVPIEFHPVDSTEIWSAVDEICGVLAGFGPRGPINLQGRVTDDGLVFFEMNPRFTGITGNRALFGFNEVALLVDNFTAGEKRRLRMNMNKIGVRQVACRAWPARRFRFAEAPPDAAPRSIVVLGGTSWLAHNFVGARAERGDSIVVVCRESSLEHAAELYSGVAGVELLGYGSRELADCLAAADAVVNCLSGRPPHGSRAILDAYLSQMRLLDLAEAADVPCVINVSSQSVYASGMERRDEQAGLDGADAYAFSKAAIEEAVRGMARRKPSVAAVSLRLARLYGPAPGMRRDEFPHRLVESAILDREIEVRKPGTVLDLLDVRDAVRALEFFVERMNAAWRGEAFNVGSGRTTTVAEYVAQVDRAARSRGVPPLRVKVREEGGAPHPGLDCGKIAQAGWSASIPMERTIVDLFEYLGHAS